VKQPAKAIAAVAPHPPAAAQRAAEPAAKPAVAPAEAMPAQHAPPARPLTQGKPPARQMVWQLGVFEDVANAEKLRDRLKEAGIPNRIEARVQVGPFATAQEAEEARKKLKAMGLDPGLLMPVKK
jgi:DedD protein